MTKYGRGIRECGDQLKDPFYLYVAFAGSSLDSSLVKAIGMEGRIDQLGQMASFYEPTFLRI
jgi:hypothetical protein